MACLILGLVFLVVELGGAHGEHFVFRCHAIVDRSKERLVSTDLAIVQARRRLIQAATDLPDGETPPGLSTESQHVRSASFVGPVNLAYPELKAELAARAGTSIKSI